MIIKGNSSLAFIQNEHPNVSASVKTSFIYSGQLQNIISSLIYTGPCFIQIEFGQCGLKPLVILIKIFF